jgi:hypothetical protein
MSKEYAKEEIDQPLDSFEKASSHMARRTDEHAVNSRKIA